MHENDIATSKYLKWTLLTSCTNKRDNDERKWNGAKQYYYMCMIQMS